MDWDKDRFVAHANEDKLKVRANCSVFYLQINDVFPKYMVWVISL